MSAYPAIAQLPFIVRTTDSKALLSSRIICSQPSSKQSCAMLYALLRSGPMAYQSQSRQSLLHDRTAVEGLAAFNPLFGKGIEL